MRVNSIDNQYRAQTYKQIAKNAGASAVLSAGLTFAVNKGKAPKTAMTVGLVAAGASLAIDAVRELINKCKSQRK